MKNKEEKSNQNMKQNVDSVFMTEKLYNIKYIDAVKTRRNDDKITLKDES